MAYMRTPVCVCVFGKKGRKEGRKRATDGEEELGHLISYEN